MDGGVALALRGERDFRDPGKARELGLRHAELARRDDQRTFGRVALHAPAPLAAGERGVVGQRRRAQHLRNAVVRMRVGGERRAFDRELALGDVAAAADLDELAGGGDRAHRHFVTRQGAGLVGADHGGGAERLDRRKLTHDGVGGCHPPHSQAQSDGHDRRQRFRNGGDRQGNGEQEQAEDDVEIQHRRAEQAGREHDRADREHYDAQPLAGAVELLLQRGRLLLGGFEQSGNAANLRTHAGGDSHRAAAAISGDRARIEHVAAIADADICVDRLDLLRHRHALAGQRSLVGMQVGVLDQAGIGGDLVPGLDHDDVAGNDLIGRDTLALALADHRQLRAQPGPSTPAPSARRAPLECIRGVR